MLKYNLRSFFKDTIIQNNEWVSNGHFIFKKSILTAGQQKMLDGMNKEDNRINGLLTVLKDQKEYFHHEKTINNEGMVFVPDVVYNYETNKINREGLYNNQLELALDKEYYNLFTSRGCKIYKGKDSINPMAIYKEGEFVGILLPIKSIKPLNNEVDYSLYIKRLEEDKQAKAELKKLNKKCLYIVNNKAVVRNKPLQCITEFIPDNRLKNIFVDAIPGGQHDYVEIYLDLEIIHMSINQSIRVDEIVDHKEAFLTLSSTTLENYKEDLQERLSDNRWINIAEVKLMELAGEPKEYVNKLIQHRKDFRELQEQKERESQLKKEKEEQEYVNEKNKITDNMITHAEQLILKGGRVTNKNVTIYEDRYTSNTTSLILHMMKLYNIKVPLRTQGWINRALHSIYKRGDGEFTYDYYNSSSNSTVFNKYLNILVDKVKEKYKNVA